MAITNSVKSCKVLSKASFNMKDQLSYMRKQLYPKKVAKKVAKKTEPTTIFWRIEELMFATLVLATIASGIWWLWNSLPPNEFFKPQAEAGTPPPMTSAHQDKMHEILALQAAAEEREKNQVDFMVTNDAKLLALSRRLVDIRARGDG